MANVGMPSELILSLWSSIIPMGAIRWRRCQLGSKGLGLGASLSARVHLSKQKTFRLIADKVKEFTSGVQDFG